mmetsp:Transcript_77783/g.207803  ORF Transcript_77783/g.207803 Transcript_77783/m.207803 type:complete len:207 (-) Transcript_77783:85-705(-)
MWMGSQAVRLLTGATNPLVTVLLSIPAHSATSRSIPPAGITAMALNGLESGHPHLASVSGTGLKSSVNFATDRSSVPLKVTQNPPSGSRATPSAPRYWDALSTVPVPMAPTFAVTVTSSSSDCTGRAPEIHDPSEVTATNRSPWSTRSPDTPPSFLSSESSSRTPTRSLMLPSGRELPGMVGRRRTVTFTDVPGPALAARANNSKI